jgi:hypothetical protein
MANGNGRKPDFNVTVPRNYEAQGEERTHWYTIGEGWQGEDGMITLRIATFPGVNFVLCPRKEKEEPPPLLDDKKKRR